MWLRTGLTLALGAALATAAAWAQPQQGHATAVAAQPAAAASAPAEKLQREGLPNLGRVGERLYRSGQPKGQGFDALKELGVTMVVNLRDDAETEERRQVESRGMRYVHIPWRGTAQADNRQVAQFLQLLRDHPGEKVLVHCRRGAERTGVMVAAYRISEHGWTAEQALDEMEEFKFLGFWFRHLKNYVRNFPAQLAADPLLQPFRPAPASAR
jgi:protein tyrosine/serine phosphatase